MKSLISLLAVVLITLMVSGCTTFKVGFAPDGKVTSLEYKYLMTNKAWSYKGATGTQLSFDTNNDAVIKLAETVSTLATKVPVVP